MPYQKTVRIPRLEASLRSFIALVEDLSRQHLRVNSGILSTTSRVDMTNTVIDIFLSNRSARGIRFLLSHGYVDGRRAFSSIERKARQLQQDADRDSRYGVF